MGVNRQSVVVAAVLGLLALGACTGEEAAPAPAPAQAVTSTLGARPAVALENGERAAADQLLVRFRSIADAQASNARTGASAAHSFADVEGAQLVQLPANKSLLEALAEYRNDPNVVYAEPNYIVHAREVEAAAVSLPNDSRFDDLWGMHNTGGLTKTADVDLNAPEAWASGTLSHPTVVMIIDTGVDYNHSDLKANMLANPGEIAGDGQDNDRNGYVDDVYGVNTITDKGDPMDDDGHGTHVAGTIAAVGNNGIGVIGVHPNAKLMACKFLGANGEGTIADALRCIEYARALKRRSQNAIDISITNNSWGGGSYSRTFRDAIRAMAEDDILFMGAAGNESTDTDKELTYPNDYDAPNVISIGAVDSRGGMPSFSNFGGHSVDIAAPGVSILSTKPGGGYQVLSGTSMATPHVSGLAALLKAQDPTRTGIEIRNLLLTSGKSLSSLKGATVSGTMIRAWDSATGGAALNCSGKTLTARTEPRLDKVQIKPNQALLLSAYHLNCENGLGPIDVTINPGAEVVQLRDDGTSPDTMANDGAVYANKTFTKAGSYTITFPNNDVVEVEVTETLTPPPTDPPDGDDGGGCGAAPPEVGLLGVAAGLVLVRRRRRS